MATLSKALTHLQSVDKRFVALSHKFVPQPWTPDALEEKVDPFQSLVLSILSQQLSGASARSISKKFIALFTVPLVQTVAQEVQIVEFFPTPKNVLELDIMTLKTAGLSTRKAEYVLAIAQAFDSGSLNDEFFATASDEDITARLVSIRGIGPWTAEMFAMFCLKRFDVLPYGDIGIQRGMAWWSGKDMTVFSKNSPYKTKVKGGMKFMTAKEMETLSAPWAPYRSIGCWFMWRVDDYIE